MGQAVDDPTNRDAAGDSLFALALSHQYVSHDIGHIQGTIQLS